MNDKMAASTTLVDVTRSDIITKYSEMEAFFGEISAKLAAIQPYEDTGFSIDEVLHKFSEFKQTVNHLFTAPPPKVVPVESPWQDVPKEEKTEDKAEEKPDVEMKEEEMPPMTD
jgi:hypothetical protein